MRTQLKNIVAVVIMALALTSCSNDDSATPVDELAELTKFKEFTNDTHTIESYSHMSVEQGYNEIKIRIKNNDSDEYVKNATAPARIPSRGITIYNTEIP